MTSRSAASRSERAPARQGTGFSLLCWKKTICYQCHRNFVIPSRDTGMRYWVECGNFFRETRRHFSDTGALLPSSRFLARALVSELHKRGDKGTSAKPFRILEVGPGYGSVS